MRAGAPRSAPAAAPRRALLAALAVLAAAGAVLLWSSPGAPAQAGDARAAPGAGGDVARGRALYATGCASCHGDDARGVRGQGPSLHGAGAASADFYLRTGRMPLAEPEQEPVRADPVLGDREIRDLVAYVASLGPGPAIPVVRPERGDLARGRALFTDHCAGCHQVAGQGGIMPGGIAPPLGQASATQVGEALRVGPYLMPVYDARQVPQGDLDSLARFVLSTRAPEDAGGWGIGHLGPIPEGMVAWFLAGVALLLVARLAGDRVR